MHKNWVRVRKKIVKRQRVSTKSFTFLQMKTQNLSEYLILHFYLLRFFDAGGGGGAGLPPLRFLSAALLAAAASSSSKITFSLSAEKKNPHFKTSSVK